MKKLYGNKLYILIFLLPALILFCGVLIAPIGASAYYSFFNWKGPGAPKTFVGLANYRELFSSNAIGFMKAPNSWCATPGSATTVRASHFITRRVMVSADLQPFKNYYIRFKSVLDDEKKEFFMDYFEYVAKEVYDNPNESEDIW